MRWRLTAALVVGLVSSAGAEPDTELTASTTAADDLGDQGIGADVGIAAGGRSTPGGMRIAGHYLYQLAAQDWFDGTASFTYGGGDPECFRDRMSTMVCDHGLASGASVEISANVRRMFAASGAFRPFARAGIGLSLVSFRGDDVNGIAIPLHFGGGVRARVSPDVAIVGQADLQLGIAGFGSDIGAEPQVGMAVTAGAEFRLK